MGKRICVAFAMALVFAFSQAWAASANVVENPGFENGVSPDPWTARGYGVSVTTNTTQPHSGARKGIASVRTATWQGIEQDMMGKMVAGQTYQITAWVRISGATSANVNISFERVDDRGTQYPSVRSVTAYSSTWTQVPLTNWSYDVVGTLSTFKIYFQGPNSGIDIYVDDVNVYGPVPAAPEPNVSADVNFSTVYQQIEGFGAAGGWYENWLTAHPDKATLYNILFAELGLDIYRLRNTYDQDGSADYMTRSEEIVTAAGTSLGHPIKILISAWSPPAYLKSNNDTNGFVTPATLKKDSNGVFMYSAYADWWADSLSAWADYEINADYVSMQNEADFETDWDSCRFEPSQTTTYAGYNQAFEAVYNELYSRMGSSMPKMLAPELTGFDGAHGSNTSAYISAFINQSHVYGYAHHLYNPGPGPGYGDTPDSYLSVMSSFAASYYESKPLFQTEYSLHNTTFDDAMNLAILMHNSLTVEGVASYFYWDLFWASPSGLVSFPSYGSTSYTINPVYYAFKHYAKFTDPNWHRVAATDDSDSLRMSAYKSPDDGNMSIVIINTSDTVDINLTLSLGSVSPESSEIYRSTSGSYWSYAGTLNLSTPLLLPKRSITTIHLTASTCPLQYDLTDDCLVDLFDLWTICDVWLMTGDCSGEPSCPDLDNSHIIDFVDIALLGTEWGL